MKGGVKTWLRPRSKYKAVRTTVDGWTFASKAEAARYQQLLLLGQAGEIRNLELQPRFPLVVNGTKVGTYTPDFRLEERAGDGWRDVVEEIKGFRVRDYVLRRNLFTALYPSLVFREIR